MCGGACTDRPRGGAKVIPTKVIPVLMVKPYSEQCTPLFLHAQWESALVSCGGGAVATYAAFHVRIGDDVSITLLDFGVLRMHAASGSITWSYCRLTGIRL